MPRFLTLVVAVALNPAVIGAPKPKDPQPPAYLPTAVGSRWVYNDDWHEELAAADVRDDGIHLTIRYGTDPAFGEHEKTLVVSSNGVYRRSAAGIFFDPVCILKLPVTVGRSWDVALAVPEFRFEYGATVTVGASEVVKVPAGTFEAVPVREETTTRNGRKLARPEVTTLWWARDVGIVRMQDESIDRRLKSFTLGNR
jgi:hypothetical protein